MKIAHISAEGVVEEVVEAAEEEGLVEVGAEVEYGIPGAVLR